jgi:hypothetical protein
MKTRVLIALTLLLTAVVTHADQSSPKRIRAFAALPDWTGLWEVEAMAKLLRAPTGQIDAGFVRKEIKIAAPPPYTAEWQAKYQAAMSDTAALIAQVSRSKTCVYAFPGTMESPRMFQVAIAPEETLIVFDNGQIRHIYTDGRAHPGKNDLWPTMLGDSIGHWHGQTLVVDTTAILQGPISPFAPMAKLSDQARFTERIQMVNHDRLEDQLTIEDPVALEHPWRITEIYSRASDIDRMIPFDCGENDRNPVVDGKMTAAPP